MLYAILVCCALVGQDAPAAVSHSADRAAYESARAAAGKSADAHAQLALWCEAHGLSAERVKHLALAVMYDPSHALARGLMGLVEFQGKWGKAEDVAEQIQNDPARQQVIREYLERRVKTASKPDDQLRLAVWCERNGLKQQALAHYNEVIRLDPKRDQVWRHLGYKSSGNRWLKPEEIAAEQREAGRQRMADKRWTLFFERLGADLESRDPAKRARAQQRGTTVADSRAVPMIWRHFVRMSQERELFAVQMLGQIDGPSPAIGLAAMAVFSPRSEVRRQATETLPRFDPRDVVEPLIDLVHKPFSYQVRRPDGVDSPGELFVEGERFNIQRFYQNSTVVPALWGARLFAPPNSFDPLSARNIPTDAHAAAIQIAAGDLAAQQDMGIRYQQQKSRQAELGLERLVARDVRAVESTNAGIRVINGRALLVLNRITGKNFGDDSEKWKAWWADQMGYSYQSSQSEYKPTYTSVVNEPPPMPALHHSCFGAGTLLRTVEGPKAIESMQVGDRVLSQDTTTGLLGFQPVVAVYHNKPSPTLRVAIGGEQIVVTGIHRFWKAGKGWTMARELKAGDRVRTVGGVGEVEKIETEKVQPVFNLEVAENRDYFVGKQGMLVHDNSLVRTVPEPFDRQPDLAALAPSTQ